MTDTVTVRGYIATAPTQKYLPKTNIPLANFRLASTPCWFDNSTGQWRESDTNWYTVNCFRALAHNSARSLHVGQPVLVTGRLKVKQFERSDGSQGTSIEIDASSMTSTLESPALSGSQIAALMLGTSTRALNSNFRVNVSSLKFQHPHLMQMLPSLIKRSPRRLVSLSPATRAHSSRLRISGSPKQKKRM